MLPFRSKAILQLNRRLIIPQIQKWKYVGQKKLISLFSPLKEYREKVGSVMITIDVESLFKNSDNENCPIYSYILKSTKNALLSEDEARIITLESTSLKL